MKEEMERKHCPLLQQVYKSHKELHVDPKLKQSKKKPNKQKYQQIHSMRRPSLPPACAGWVQLVDQVFLVSNLLRRRSQIPKGHHHPVNSEAGIGALKRGYPKFAVHRLQTGPTSKLRSIHTTIPPTFLILQHPLKQGFSASFLLWPLPTP